VASINKAALRNRVLEHLGVLAAGETPATADQTFVEEVIDAAHAELRRKGLVPFATSAVPEWAQLGMRSWVAAECGPAYGKPWGPGDVMGMKLLAEQQLAKQVAGLKPNRRIRGTYF
jgi:hypothetical protein